MEEQAERDQTWWQKHSKLLMRTVLIASIAVVIVLIILSILGYIFNWDWTGLGPYVSPPHSKDSDFQRGKTLWDWLQLLIIPAVLAVAGYVINLTISRSEQEATEQRDTTEREIALDRQYDVTLKEYIDGISELLLHEQLRESKPEDEVRAIARVWTLLTITRLDALRRRHVIDFLRVANLIGDQKIIDLERTTLNGVSLMYQNLSGVNLKSATLRGADLTSADLRGADLTDADLRGADLTSADLTSADLTDAIVTPEQLNQAKSLTGATMPDGSIHE